MNKKAKIFFIILPIWFSAIIFSDFEFPEIQGEKYIRLKKRLFKKSSQEKNINTFEIALENAPNCNLFLSRLTENPSGTYPNSWFKIGSPTKGLRQIVNIKEHKMSLALEKMKNSNFNFTAYCYIVGGKTFSSFKIAEMFRWLNFFILNIKSCWYLKIQGTVTKNDMKKIKNYLSEALSILKLPLP